MRKNWEELPESIADRAADDFRARQDAAGGQTCGTNLK